MNTSLLPSSYRRLPAEWEPLEAVWIAWPHNSGDWPGVMDGVVRAYAELTRILSRSGGGLEVRIVVRDEAMQGSVLHILTRAGANLGNVRFLRALTDRSWTRDTLPFFVHTGGAEGGVEAVDFAFNGWARYPDHLLDARLGGIVAAHLELPLSSVARAGRSVVLEGGAVDCNGRGDLLATEECLLDSAEQCRNPGMSARDYEDVFREHMGIANVIWLGRGIVGDDTHGHVDDFCRFVAPDKVVLCREDNPRDPNHAVLEENCDRLESARLADGARLKIARLPMPAPRYLDDLRLPASYANFLIANNSVLVPVFNDPNDKKALGIIAELFPGRNVEGVDASDLILGLGAIHCLTHEQPKPDNVGT